MTAIDASPPPPAAPGAAGDDYVSDPRHRNRAPVWALVVCLGLLITSLIGASLLAVPYVAVRPGKAPPVVDLIRVEGVDTYPPQEGTVAFTTVRSGGTTMLEAVHGWLDDDIDVFPEEVVRGDRSAEENRRYNAELMTTSKSLATAVALNHLGHEVSVFSDGTIVRAIGEGMPADGVLELDDVIVAVDGQAVDTPDKLGALLQVGGVGAAHTLTVERPPGGDVTIDVELPTVADPNDAERAIIGIAPEDRITGFDFPFDVFIDSGNVGGPSAGLAFTLALIDLLTPGELTGGHKVAVTGTIRLDGTVGPVGGGAQKAIAARNAGFEVFLVPPDELEEVKTTLGGDFAVIAVSTLDEALEALVSLGGDVGSTAAAATADT